jgi:hypothetical protein
MKNLTFRQKVSVQLSFREKSTTWGVNLYIGASNHYPARMLKTRFITLAGPLLLAACETVTPTPPPVAPAASCPEPPEQSCPVCPQVSCPEPQVLEKVVEVPVVATAGELGLLVIGAVEWATVEPGNLRMEARIDTGAETTSIHAENIELVERDGKRYVRFDLLDGEGGLLPMEVRLRRRVLIKQHDREPERRYVVRMWVTVGEVRSRIDVNLSDREDFEYPLLIGRNFLVDAMVVDVSRQHTLAPGP